MRKALDEFVGYSAFERRYARNTVLAYRQDVEDFVRFWEENPPAPDISEISTFHIRLYLGRLSDTSSPATVQRKFLALKMFFRYLAAKGRISVDPMFGLRTPKASRPCHNFLTKDEAMALVDFKGDGSPRALRDRALIMILYGCGLRVAEASDLDLKSLNLKAGTARVFGKGSKWRMVPIGEAILAALKSYLKVRHKIVCKTRPPHQAALFLNNRGGRMGVRAIELMAKKRGKAAGLSRPLRPHDLRHTYATHLMDAGVDIRSIQALLGHSHISTTQIYTHVTTKHLFAVYDKAHPLANPATPMSRQIRQASPNILPEEDGTTYKNGSIDWQCRRISALHRELEIMMKEGVDGLRKKTIQLGSKSIEPTPLSREEALMLRLFLQMTDASGDRTFLSELKRLPAFETPQRVLSPAHSSANVPPLPTSKDEAPDSDSVDLVTGNSKRKGGDHD